LSSESIRDPFHVIEGGDFKTPNKQLASIRTFQERRNNKLISGYFFPASCAAKKSKFSNTIIILSQGTGGNSSLSSSARVPGPRASYILCRRIA